MKRKYVFKPYDPVFPVLFERERTRIASALGSVYPIEHYGSTAVPGLGGKGIIDICIGVPRDQMEMVSGVLQSLGYVNPPNSGDQGRLFHEIKLPDETEGVRLYHVHVMDSAYSNFAEMLRLRDYMRVHPEDCERYAEAKRQAAAAALEDGDTYVKLKVNVLNEIKATAGLWEGVGRLNQ